MIDSYKNLQLIRSIKQSSTPIPTTAPITHIVPARSVQCVGTSNTVTCRMYAATTSKLLTTITFDGVTQQTAFVIRMLPKIPTKATIKLRIHSLIDQLRNKGFVSRAKIPMMLTTRPPTPNQKTRTE